MKLLPREQSMLKEWKGNAFGLFLKRDNKGIYLVFMAHNKIDLVKKLTSVPFYPYMKIEINALT